MTRTVLLALDTSTEYCSVALLRADTSLTAEGQDTAERPLSVTATAATEPRVWTRHEATGAVSSTRLLPAIRDLFDEAQLSLADCDAIAFGSGPGSFTGLRTATGVAQGLAFGLDRPVVPVGTLLACAESARLRDPSVARVVAALDARMDEVYWADFAWDDAAGDWRTVHPAALAAPDALPLPDEPFTLAGNAAAAFGERLTAASAAHRVDHDAVPHALPVALAALRAFRAGRTVPADQAAPEYVRDKVAQTTEERLAAKATLAAATESAPRPAACAVSASAGEESRGAQEKTKGEAEGKGKGEGAQ